MNETHTKPSTWHASFIVAKDAAERIGSPFDWPETFIDPPTTSVFETENPAEWLVEIFAGAEPSDTWSIELTSFLSQLAGTSIPPLSFVPMTTKNWVEESQKLNQAIDAGRFVVFGAHARPDYEQGRLPIELEARLAFGAGSHETTQGCLMALDQLANGSFSPTSVLDIGTGSGILAIGAHKLWPVPTIASDNDPVAITVTSENMAKNHIMQRELGQMENAVALLVAEGLSGPQFARETPFDLIIANILKRPLIDMAGDVMQHLSLGGYVILSGILQDQASAVVTAYKAHGARPSGEIPLGDWTTLIMMKPAKD